MSEITAIKVEIAEAIKRRFTDDPRSPADYFTVAIHALSELLADLTFAAAKNEDHGRRLLTISQGIIEQRWRENAAAEGRPR